jgi:hypothetical protein
MLPPLSRKFLEDKNRLEAWREETAGRHPIPDELWKAAVFPGERAWFEPRSRWLRSDCG